MKEHTTMSEAKVIAMMRAEGRSVRAISRKTGRARATVDKVLARPETQAAVAEARTDLVGAFENLAQRMVASITDEDIGKISAYQRTLSAAVATDKFRLLSGQSTDNVAVLISAAVRDEPVTMQPLEVDGDEI